MPPGDLLALHRGQDGQVVAAAMSILSAIMVWTLVLAAGSGSRYGGPKQFERLGGRRIIDRSVAAAGAVSDGVVLVVPLSAPGLIPDEAGASPRVDVRVQGGASRSDSVRAGLAVVPADADVVVVHDAARPLASRAIFERVINAVNDGADAAVPAVPVVDTVKRVQGRDVVETLDRSELVAVQTPQAFAADVLRRAHADGGDATDDAGLVESMGGSVVVVEGGPENLKITCPQDLLIAETFLS